MALSLTGQLAHAAANSTGGAIPPLPDRSMGEEDATTKDYADPKYRVPDDPGVDCVSNMSPEDAKTIQYNAGIVAGKNCLPQADAFRRAGEAASYLGHYYTNFTPFANELRGMKEDDRRKFNESIRDCVSNSPDCDNDKRKVLLKAMVQYNFGKEIRANVLESNSRADRMGSIDLGAKGWRDLGVYGPKVLTYKNTLRTGSLRKNTFRLDPTKTIPVDMSKKSQAERAMLGAAFMNDYRGFIDAYTKTTEQKSRWHFVAAKSSAVAGENAISRAADDGYNLDPKLGKTLINRTRLDADIRSQGTEKVNEIVKVFKEDLNKESKKRNVLENGKAVVKSVEWSESHPSDILADDIGFGLAVKKNSVTDEVIDPKLVAQGVVININKAIVDTEEKMAKRHENERVPSSTGASAPRKIIPSVSVDIEKFDQFLEAIWPADVAKPR